MRKFRKTNTKRLHQRDYETAFREEERKWYHTLFALFRTPVVFWVCVFLCLLAYLQKQGVYHFYYIEQEQLFLYDKHYFYSLIMQPGGFARWLAEYCVQFFVLPFAGAWILSAWLTAIAIFAAGLIRRIAPTSNLFVLSIFPSVFFLYVSFDTNYFYTGTIAYSLMLLALGINIGISKLFWRLFAALLLSALLFWSAGAVAFLFVICVFLWEFVNNFSRAYLFILPIGVVVGLSAWCVTSSLVGDYRFLLFPDGYFAHNLRPGIPIYLSWIFLLVLILLCRFLRYREPLKGGRKYMERIVQLILAGFAFGFGASQYVKPQTEFYKELDYCMRTEQWDAIVELCKGDLKNYLYKSSLNVALAEKNELAERMFSFDQKGAESIFIPWNRQRQVSVQLSDVYFSMGHVALSQRMAFEANVAYSGSNPRMLKRLVQTNLIFGSYSVAEKYISILEKTKYYKKWALAHRQLLWDDEAVAADSVLGSKQKCIPSVNQLSEIESLETDLKRISEQNPAHRSSIEYAGALSLLKKDMFAFQSLLDTYYGTEVLPTLPKSFQEGVFILFEHDSTYLKYEISYSTVNRYREYRERVLENQNNKSVLPKLLKSNYEDTYWYYYMFK